MKKTRSWLLILNTVCLPLFWIVLKFSGWQWQAYPILTSLISGLAIIDAGFLLCWAADVAQKDISQILALVFLALIAVLPEYAVDMYFAWVAGKNPAYIPYAAANMTGANRLLIGIGWTLMLFLAWLTGRTRQIKLEEPHKIEISALCLATLYCFIIPIKGTLSLIDAIVLITLFVFYIIAISREVVVEPELSGVALEISMLPTGLRRLTVIFLFLYAGFLIFISAEPFAEGLIMSGRSFGINEFILIQWLAPLASEAPELIAASLFVLKAKPNLGLGILVSSKVNQWTLLVGLLPVAFSISGTHLCPMVLDARQREEIFLTAAQSVLAVTFLSKLNLSFSSALVLLILFLGQLVFPSREIRLIFSFAYLSLTLFVLLKDRDRLRSILSFIMFKGLR